MCWLGWSNHFKINSKSTPVMMLALEMFLNHEFPDTIHKVNLSGFNRAMYEVLIHNQCITNIDYTAKGLIHTW